MDDWHALIADPGVPDETLVALANRSDADPAALAALSVDAARLARAPAIAEAIYRNARAPLSVANRAIVSCHQAGAVPEGIVGFEELVRSILAEPTALDPAAVDLGFAQLIDATANRTPGEGEGEPEPEVEPLPEVGAELAGAMGSGGSTGAGSVGSDRPGTSSGQAKRRRSATIDFTRLKLYEKIRLATLGNAYCRQNLLRDANRMVAMAAIRSPQITDGEVAQAAGNRALGEEVIRYIANRKELVKQYPVKLALVGNVKCPLVLALRLLPTLNAEDIKRLARSKNIPGALSAAAKKLAAGRGPQ